MRAADSRGHAWRNAGRTALLRHGSATGPRPTLCCRIVLNIPLTAGGAPRQRRMERRPPADLLPFVARNHARQAKPDRALAPLSMLATLAPPAANAAWRGARSGRKGSRSGAFGRLCRTKAQAGRPWIHAAFRPCGTRAAFAATNVAAHAAAKAHITHNAVNTILQQGTGQSCLDAPPGGSVSSETVVFCAAVPSRLFSTTRARPVTPLSLRAPIPYVRSLS